MTRLRIFLSRLAELFRRDSREAALREDIGTHIDLLTDEYLARGLPADDARAAARRAFGGVEQVRMIHRDQRGLPWLDTLSQDLRQAVTGLRRNPGFAAAALATLALAIGATTAVFSLVYGVLLRPLPFVEPQTLVRMWEEHPGGNTIAGQRWLSHWTYHAWGDHERTLSQFGGYVTWSTILQVDEEAFPAGGSSLTPSLVSMLGARPALGRWFVESDAAPGAPQVVVLSHRLWQERFGGRADVLGRTMRIDGEAITIVGVATPDMEFPNDRSDCWRPYAIPMPAADAPGRTFGFNAVARLRPGVTPEQLEAEGTSAARSVERPMSTDVIFGKGGPVVVHARPLVEDMAATVRPALLALSVAVAIVLLVACANVANLLLSRGVARQREYAIRMAVGASRARLVRQSLTESLVLAGGAGLVGTALAAALVRALPVVAPRQFPRLDDVRLDARVLAAAAVVTLAAALISGLLPAIRSAGADAIASIRGGDGGVAEGFRTRGARRMRDGLLVLESALAVVLLVGALLVGHSLVRLMNVDAGYTPESVVTATISMPRGSKPERGAAFLDAMLARLDGRSDVAAAGAATTMPMVSMTAVTSFPIVPSPGEDEVMTRSVTYVATPGYAEAIGLRVEEGRFFTPDDQRPGVRALIVNEEFVRRYLRGTVVGRRFERQYGDEGVIPTEIVGVVGNVLKDGHDQAVEPEIYYAHGAVPFSLANYFSIAIRTYGDPGAVAGSFRELAASIDRGAVVERVDRLEDRVSASMAQPRFATTVLALLAALGLALASVGLFAVLSYTVSQRRRELGVRAALGAGRSRILRLVLRQGLTVTMLGLALGLLVSAGLTRFLEGLLFGVTPLDTLSFVLAPVVLLPAAALASLVPALRAATVDPAVVLREE
jgi:putative ABC transport system permease protein